MSDKTNTKPVNVLITCVGGKFMYDFITCLRSIENIKVIGVDADPEAVGQIISDEFQVIPMASSDPEAFVKITLEIIRKYDIDIFIPSADEEVTATVDHYKLYEEQGVILPFGNPELVNTITDKYNLLNILKKYHLYEDDFYLVQNKDELDHKLEALGYPDQKIIAKPRSGRGSRGVFLFDGKLNKYTPFLEHRFCGSGTQDVFIMEMENRDLPISDLVLMPYYEGAFYDVDIIAKDGELKDICIRLRQLKNQFSPTSTGHKICMKPEVIEYAAAVCEAVNADGIFDIDIIEVEGKMIAIDAAFRFSGSVGASRVAGHNMPAQLIRSLLGQDIKPMNVKNHTILRPFWTMQSIEADKENIAL